MSRPEMGHPVALTGGGTHCEATRWVETFHCEATTCVETYHQVGAVKDAYKGCKAWIPPEAPEMLSTARLGIPADISLGSIGRR